MTKDSKKTSSEDGAVIHSNAQSLLVVKLAMEKTEKLKIEKTNCDL